MLLFATIMILPNWSLLASHSRLRPLAGLIGAMMVACTSLFVIAFWGGISRAWSGARAWLRRLPKGEWLERSLDACRRFGEPRFFVIRALAISIGLDTVWVF